MAFAPFLSGALTQAQGYLQTLVQIVQGSNGDIGQMASGLSGLLSTILTDLVRQSILTADAARKSVMSRTPLRRAGEPAEIASIALFLATEESSYITGQILYADGGRMALNYTVPVDD